MTSQTTPWTRCGATNNLVIDSNTTAQEVATNASTAESNAAIRDADNKLMAEVSAIVQSKKGVTLSKEGEIGSSKTTQNDGADSTKLPKNW